MIFYNKNNMIQEYELTNPECAILSLVAEGPRYGYQIEQIVAARGMRRWTEIGFSSIYYILNKLAAQGSLAAETQDAGSRPSRRVYRILPTGMDTLRKETRLRLCAPRLHTSDFDLALALLPLLSLAEALADLAVYRASLIAQLDEVRAKWKIDQADSHFPWQVNELFDHGAAMLEADLAWVTQSIQRIQKHDPSFQTPRS